MPETVLLTGVTGFIAKRIALDLLNAGHAVRGSLRSLDRADEVRAAVRPRLTDDAALDRLEFVSLDLSADDGWTDAMAGIDVLMHTASPFPMVAPKDEDQIIRPAVDGTLRALKAAHGAGVFRVVLTSSVVAIEAKDNPDGTPFTEADWSDPDHPKSTAYYKSKTLAERAAWAFCEDHPEMRLTTINPALVLGRPLDRNYGTSLQVIERIMGAKDPALPDIGFGIVDVAEVSAMHLAAMARPETAGSRYIASGHSAKMPEIAMHLNGLYPDRKIPTRRAPRVLLRFLSLFDPSIRTILPALGNTPRFDNGASQRDLGVAFQPWTDTVAASAAFLAEEPR